MTADTTATTPLTGAGRREWTGLAVLALPTLLLALDASVLYVALPRLSADLPVGAAAQARDGLAGAVTAAGELPAATGAALVDGARAAYTGGLTVTATAGAVLLVALAALAALAFRSIRPYASREQPADDGVPTR